MKFDQRYRVPTEGFELRKRRTSEPGLLSKSEARAIRERDIDRLGELQERLYAEGKRSLLVILQGLDASGKDSTIEHVFTGVNPQGVLVTSFKEPTHLELAHDFLWRCQLALPRAGEIGIFNRSHYEEVLVTRVHPELLADRGVDPRVASKDGFWKQRLEDIVAWERHLDRNGTRVVKMFVHVSQAEQRSRLLARAEDPTKQWKFSPRDLVESDRFEDYQHAYDRMLRATSTSFAPWYVIPADEKWLMRTAVAAILVHHLQAMDPQYPAPSEEQRAGIEESIVMLRGESGGRRPGRADG